MGSTTARVLRCKSYTLRSFIYAKAKHRFRQFVNEKTGEKLATKLLNCPKMSTDEPKVWACPHCDEEEG